MEELKETNKIEIEDDSLKYLNTIRKWTMFLSIMGFIVIGILVIIGSFTGVFLSVFNKGNTLTGFPEWLVLIVLLLMAVISFSPILYLFRFSKYMSEAVKSLDKQELNKAFKNLKSYYVFTGILVILILVIYVIVIITTGVSVAFLK